MRARRRKSCGGKRLAGIRRTTSAFSHSLGPSISESVRVGQLVGNYANEKYVEALRVVKENSVVSIRSLGVAFVFRVLLQNLCRIPVSSNI